MTNDELFLDELYKEFVRDKDLMSLLGNPTTATGRNKKIRRGVTPLEYATSDAVNFLSMHFSSSTETDNWYVTRGFLHIDYYVKDRKAGMKIKQAVRRILSKKHQLHRASGRDVGAIAKGVLFYRDTFRPLLRADY